MTDNQFLWQIVVPLVLVLVIAILVNIFGDATAAYFISAGGVAVVFGGNLLWFNLRR